MTFPRAVSRILIWGPTQVGKTALLATALYGGDPALASVVRADEGTSLNRELFDVIRRLKNNQWVPPTGADSTVILLPGVDGGAVELVDVRGGLTLEIQGPSARDLVRSAHAMLFLVEYMGQDTGNQMAAIEAAVLEMGDKPVALALTKCERWLLKEDDIWNCPEGWLEQTPLWATHHGTLRRFGGKAWPTSAFGYEESTGLPAVILGEMGQLLPFRINPRNVAQPLASLLRTLGCL